MCAYAIFRGLWLISWTPPVLCHACSHKAKVGAQCAIKHQTWPACLPMSPAHSSRLGESLHVFVVAGRDKSSMSRIKKLKRRISASFGRLCECHRSQTGLLCVCVCVCVCVWLEQCTLKMRRLGFCSIVLICGISPSTGYFTHFAGVRFDTTRPLPLVFSLALFPDCLAGTRVHYFIITGYRSHLRNSKTWGWSVEGVPTLMEAFLLIQSITILMNISAGFNKWEPVLAV